MKSFIMSEQNLRALGACQDGINFLKVTGLIGLDFYKLKIKGDYKGYVDWITNNLRSKCKDNKKGQITEVLDLNTYKFKYNDHFILKEVNRNNKPIMTIEI